MERRKFSREFKLEAVNLVRDRGVSIVQAARDLDINHNMLRRWLKSFISLLSLSNIRFSYLSFKL